MKTKFFKTLFVLLISLPFGEGWGGVLMAQNLTVCRAASYSVPSAVAATGASSYEWLENGKVIPDVTGVSYTNAAGKTEAGTYVYVRRAYLQSCGEWQNSNDFVVHVTGTMPTVTRTGSGTVCQNTNVVFTASGGGTGATYTWSGTAGTASGTGNCSYTVSGATTGTKSVTAYATAPSNGVNCISATSGAATATVTALPATPTVTRTGSGTVCVGTNVVFTASGGGTSATYTWTGASTGTASGAGSVTLTVSGATTGTKSVTAYATAPSSGVNCVSATSGAATATVTALPTITLLSGGTNQSVNPGTAITQIKYTTANASSVTVSNLPAGISGTWTSNTLTIGGSSTVMGAKIYTVTTANSNGCTNATASGTITVQFFNSSSTWSYGGLTWSDQVNVAACNKTTFTNNLTEPQCRSYTVDGVLIYYYNWPYVNANKSAMCPSPWRVPTRNDFDVLISTTPRYTLIDQWGYGGRANSNSIELTNYGHYMSSTEYDDFNVFTMFYGYYNEGVGYEGKTFGMQVRCVK